MSASVEGARCAHHVEAAAEHACARCGDFLCVRCVAVGHEDGAYCDGCAEHAGPAFPWEERGELGLGRALTRTLLGTLFGARALYARGFRDRSALPALAYGIALSTPVALVLAAVELLWPSPIRLALSRMLASGWMFSDAAVLARGLGAPLLFVVSTLLVASVWWVGLKGASAATRPFSHVVRACAYVSGSMAPLQLCELLPGPTGGLLVGVLLITIALQGLALQGTLRVKGSRVLGAAIVAIVFSVLAVVALAFLVAGVFAVVAERTP